jgi:hypothetical protein
MFFAVSSTISNDKAFYYQKDGAIRENENENGTFSR